MTEHGSSLRRRGALGFLVALSPLIVAVIVNGPSLQIYAGFGSGLLVAVTTVAYFDAYDAQKAERMPRFPPEPEHDGEAGPLGF